MDTDGMTIKLPWVAPEAVPLTGTDGRADQRDVTVRNGFDGEPAISPGT